MGISLLANPPYNMKWKVPELAGFLPQYMGYETPPASNANMAFVLTALNYTDDRAVILLPNSVLSSSQKHEVSIRQQLISQNLLLAVVSLPGNMFESTNIPTCLLVFDKHKDTRKVAMIDLQNHCEQEVRDQRGQFGGKSHTNRTYHKTVQVIPAAVIRKCLACINDKNDADGFCRWVLPEEIKDSGWNLTPRRYYSLDIDCSQRSLADIANDYNRVIAQKNAIQIKMNKTAAKRLGYDCMNVNKPDVSQAFEIVGLKADKEKSITFSADDGITIKVSTKKSIHPLIIDFLNHWKQMIIHLNNEENLYLAEYRDALLPKLMNGEIELDSEERKEGIERIDAVGDVAALAFIVGDDDMVKTVYKKMWGGWSE